MRFIENRRVGRGVREFHNVDPAPNGRRPGHLDLGWAKVVRQIGTKDTGRVERVMVFYVRGIRRKRTFRGRQADKVLKAVQEHRLDAAH